MIHKGLVCGTNLSQSELRVTPPQCDASMKGKATCTSFPASESRHAKSVLDLVHSNLWGPAPVISLSRTCYVLMLTDNKSHWLWVHFLKSKSEAYKAFVEWLTYVEMETGQVLCPICTDNGGGYLSKLWDNFLKDQDICHELTSPYTHKQNGLSECQNHSIFDHVCTILIDSSLPLYLWPEAVNYVIHTKNHHVTCLLQDSTPYGICYGMKPDISAFHPFGCKVYAYNHLPEWNKLELHAIEGIFVGYLIIRKPFRYIFLVNGTCWIPFT